MPIRSVGGRLLNSAGASFRTSNFVCSNSTLGIAMSGRDKGASDCLPGHIYLCLSTPYPADTYTHSMHRYLSPVIEGGLCLGI